MRTLWQDVRYGARMLIRRPAFTATIVVTLALGVGACAAVFGVVNAFLLRPLPFAEPDRLVIIQSERGGEKLGVSFPDYLDWRRENRVFDDMAFMNASWLANVNAEGENRALPATLTTPNLFAVLGVAPLIGRSFTEEDGAGSSKDVVILSHGLWVERFGADPDIINRRVRVDDANSTVVGVMPRGFGFPSQSRLWSPASEWMPERAVRIDTVIARLKPGASVDEARAEMKTVAAGLAQSYPDSNDGVGVRVTPLRDFHVGDIRQSLLLLLSACAFVLLIACANVANLLLARATTRESEMAIRAALGASRGRLMRQLLIEGLLLATLGAAGGMVLAVWGVEALVASIPVELPFWVDVRVDATVLGFTVALAALTAVIFSLIPAWQSSQIDLNHSLKEAGKGAIGGRGRSRARDALVVAEIALALVLTIGAGLVAQSFARLQRVDPGFVADNVLTIEIKRVYRGGQTAEEKLSLYKRALERIAALPGVEAIGANSDLPFVGQETWDRVDYTIEGQSIDDYRRNPAANIQLVSPDYFRAMNIPLVAGRHFTEQDVVRDSDAAIISRGMAERFWPGADPVGKRFKAGGPNEGSYEWQTVVGVVGDVRHNGLADAAGFDWYRANYHAPIETHFVVRTKNNPTLIAAAARREIWQVSPDLGVSRVMPLDQLTQNSIWQPRLWGMLFGVFSTIALVLAAAGIYGVIAYSVAQRTREIGIRLALGAQPRNVFRMIVGQGLTLALAGVFLGLAAAFALTRVMASLLYEVSSADPPTFVLVALLLCAVALVACYVPARRASKVNPLVALRYE